MQGGLVTVVPKYFMRAVGATPGTRLILLEEPTITQRVGLVWIEGTPMLPMTKAVVELMEEALESGTLTERLG